MANDILIKIGASSKQFQEELDKVSAQTETLKAQFESVGKYAAAAFAATSAAIGFSINEFAEAEKAVLKTNAVLKATGSVAGVSAEQVKKLSESLQKTTAFSDEAIREGQNLLLTFTKIGSEVFPSATEATLDLATKMGTDAASAAQILGKALQDPERGLTALQRSGILFSEGQKKTIETMISMNRTAEAQKIILDQVNASVGGLAKEAASGVSGSFSKLKNAFSDIGEELGSKFAPLAKEAADGLVKLLQAAKENDAAITALANTLKVAFVASGAVAAIAALGAAAAALPAVFAAVGAGIAILTGPLGLLIAGAAAAAAIVNAATTLKAEKETRNPRNIQNTLTDSKRADDLAMTEKEAQKKREEQQKKHQQQLEKDQNEHNARKRLMEIEQVGFLLGQAQGVNEELLALQKSFYEAQFAAEEENDVTKKALLQQRADELYTQVQEQSELTKAQQEEFEASLAEIEERYHLEKIDRTSNLYKDLEQQARKNFQTQKQLQESFLADELQKKVQNNKQKYDEDKKHGKAYAELQDFLRTNEVGQSLTFFATMQNMQKSHNQTLKTIGKAAALVQIAINTASAATYALGAFPIPFIGPALGMAAAAAIVAYGIEQAAEVTGAKEGGLVTGGIPGQDSVPYMLAPGELVVPQQNFEEVVGAVTASRAGGSVSGSDGQGGGQQGMLLEIMFSGDASRMLTARQIEDKRLGVSRNPNA